MARSTWALSVGLMAVVVCALRPAMIGLSGARTWLRGVTHSELPRGDWPSCWSPGVPAVCSTWPIAISLRRLRSMISRGQLEAAQGRQLRARAAQTAAKSLLLTSLEGHVRGAVRIVSCPSDAPSPMQARSRWGSRALQMIHGSRRPPWALGFTTNRPTAATLRVHFVVCPRLLLACV